MVFAAIREPRQPLARGDGELIEHLHCLRGREALMLSALGRRRDDGH